MADIEVKEKDFGKNEEQQLKEEQPVFTQSQVEELLNKKVAEMKKSSSTEKDALQSRIEHLSKKVEGIESERKKKKDEEDKIVKDLAEKEEKARLEKANIADELMKTRKDMEELMKISTDTVEKISAEADRKISLYKAEMAIQSAISKSSLPAKFLKRYIPTPEQYLESPEVLKKALEEAEEVYKEISPETKIPDKDTTKGSTFRPVGNDSEDLLSKVFSMDAKSFKEMSSEIAKKYGLNL